MKEAQAQTNSVPSANEIPTKTPPVTPIDSTSLERNTPKEKNTLSSSTVEHQEVKQQKKLFQPKEHKYEHKKEIAGDSYDFSRRFDLERYQRMLDTALELCRTAQDLWKKDRFNEAFTALDDAYALILKVDPDSKPELIQQKEDLRFLIAKRILEIHASRYITAKGLHTEIPLVENSEVMMEIKRFQGPERKFFLDAYRRSGKYRPMIAKELREAGLPEELSWLPLIESGFKETALSHARALGLWQFIASTGYKYGLNQNTWTDERLDPEKSTKAAIKYLTELHQIFGDWMTVLAAYNCGEGTVLRIIRSQRINYLDHFWDFYQMLPVETARYVPKFIAALFIIKEPKRYGFDLPDPAPPVAYEKVEVKKQLHLAQIAEAIGVPKKVLKDLNPELRYQITPPHGYSIKVPPGKGSVLLAKLDSIPPWTLSKKAFVYHRVRKGETLASIAMKYGIKIRDIVLTNNIRHMNLIRIGQRLRIPLSRSKNYAPFYRKRQRRYVVKAGDSLWLIARKLSISVKSIKKTNNLYSNRLKVGQVLKIPD